MSKLLPVIPDLRQEEQNEPVSELEKLFRVLVRNDDVTPYDFVIMVLIRFFKLDPYQAELITWTAHNSGSALVAILPLSDAQRKVGQAQFAASLENYPLTFVIEPE